MLSIGNKDALFAAEAAFKANTGENFNKALFDLLAKVNDLALYQHRLEVRYYASFNSEQYAQDRSKNGEVLQIEKYIAEISEEVLNHNGMATFHPPFFKGMIPITDLTDDLQKKAVFMLLACTKDENFREFSDHSRYTLVLLNLTTELVNKGDKTSYDMVSIIDSGNF